MTKETFFELLTNEVKSYKEFLETDSKDWIVKGFIDVDKNVYTITNDTKVVSKIIEILLIPKLDNFARNHGLELELPSKQNFYPDLTFKDQEGHLFAVDVFSLLLVERSVLEQFEGTDDGLQRCADLMHGTCDKSAADFE